MNAGSPRGTAGRRHILLVEDSRTQAEALRSLLDDAGFDAEVARTGAEALRALSGRPVDLVISDVMMPGMSGFQLCQAIRGHPALGDVPFIVLTSLTDPLDIMRGIECGADNYVTKPYEPEVLLHRIERTLDQSRRTTSASPREPITVSFLGKDFAIESSRERILDVLVSSFEDVTRANAALRVAEAEREVLYEKERQARLEAEDARARAEEANRAKSEFLAMMSHDLRTPLNAIGGYAELLAIGVRGAMNDTQLANVERIRRNQRHLLGLVNDVLSFARLETGEIPLDIRPIRLNETIAPLRAVIAPQAAARSIEYRFESCHESVIVRADAERVEQVLINLLGNAIKFTPDGGIVTMRCGVRDDVGFVNVEDTGIGIPADKLSLIFDPFVQAGGNSAMREGVGLGLAISRKLARVMGGDVVVRSEEGRGSRFSLMLPLESELV